MSETVNPPQFRYELIMKEAEPMDVFADAVDLREGMMLFYQEDPISREPDLVLGINLSEVAMLAVHQNTGESDPEDPQAGVHDSSLGYNVVQMVSNGNPFVSTEPEGPDLSKPKHDPFRGGQLREKR